MSRVGSDVRRGEYGVDGDFSVVSARWQAVIVTLLWLVLVVWTVWNAVAAAVVGAVVTGVLAAWLLVFVGSYLWTTRAGKFAAWKRILAEMGLRGDERLLDLGCGRGAILLTAAKMLPRGQAVGVDLWRADQTGNGPDAARRNAEREGVSERVELHTGDMRRLPFADNTFDVVISNLAIHNIPSAADRRAAIDEAVRVLRPHGKLAIVDLWATNRHSAQLRDAGLADIRRRNVGWRMWWGGPWAPSHLVTATKNS
jgi:arsenite methyltransferase